MSSRWPSISGGSETASNAGTWLLFALLCVHAQPLWASDSQQGNPFLPPGLEDRGWPFVRGATFDSHSPETHIAEQWPASGPPVLWVRELGQGYSALVAFGDRVYTQAQSLAGQFVYCLDADSGETIWRYRYAGPYQLAGVYPGPRATPAISGQFVYFAAPDGLVGCLTSESGKLVWSRNVVEDYQGDGGVGFGFSCSPTVVDGMVLLPVGGPGASIVALDPRDGSEIWTAGDDPASYSPAYPITIDGRPLVIGYMENALVLCDRNTGELIARRELSAGYDEHSAWPIFSEPHLWLSGPFRAGSQLLELSPAAEKDRIRTIWDSEVLSNDVVSSVLVDGHIYGFDLFEAQSKTHRPSRGKFRCIELSTGNVKWSQGSGRHRRSLEKSGEAAQEIGQAGIIAADGKLILLNELGDLILLRADANRCDELARASVLKGEITWTPPTLHRGRVYVRNHSRAVCVYVGEERLLRTDAPVLEVADLPQQEYRDWATLILAIEPEYAFDIPTTEWLWNWYFASFAILIVAELGGFLSKVLLRPLLRKVDARSLGRLIAFVMGVVGTTLLSRLTGDFVFTWPVCLFVAFANAASPANNEPVNHHRILPALTRRIPLLCFVVTSVVYFLVCRRLSLVFEWSYLAGFVAALPFLQIQKRLPGRRAWWLMLEWLAFTSFYAAGVALLVLKY